MKNSEMFFYKFICFILAALIMLGTQAKPAQALFGAKETSYKNMKLFPKWQGMLERHLRNQSSNKDCSTNNKACQLEQWKTFLSSIKNLDRMQQIKSINQHMNEANYIIDPINYGVEDYWATPFQFFSKDGDCEDYAIAKFMSLREIGVPNDNLRVVVLQDKNLGIVHSVLAVNYEGNTYILDNQIDSVIKDDKIHHYQPIYSINETNWWRYQ